MSEFDRELAKCIGSAVAITGKIDRVLIASCYQQVLTSLNLKETDQVSEKWINFLTDKLDDLKVSGRNNKQIANMVFERIAKT